MNTTENNKIIAEFMGGLKNNESRLSLHKNEIWLPKHGICHLGNNGKVLKYHSDWNWLMEVVEKIFTLDLYYDKYIDFNVSMFSDGKIQLSTRIDLVYNQCVEFIKWYSEANK